MHISNLKLFNITTSQQQVPNSYSQRNCPSWKEMREVAHARQTSQQVLCYYCIEDHKQLLLAHNFVLICIAWASQ